MSETKKGKKVSHSGSTFDRFLEEEGIREEVEAVAIKRVLAWEQAVEPRSNGQPRAAVPTGSKTKSRP
jgi:antitoxin HicB